MGKVQGWIVAYHCAITPWYFCKLICKYRLQMNYEENQNHFNALNSLCIQTMNKRTYKCGCVFNVKRMVQYNLARNWVSRAKSSIFLEKWLKYFKMGINEFSIYANLRFYTGFSGILGHNLGLTLYSCIWSMVFWQEEHVYEGFWQAHNPVRFVTGRFKAPPGSWRP